ncbi:hypothetical protein [Marinobacter sp.]|uniref:hypothetical protein n=1 Tax=Marinobacter sp. TaxID=50741 RepID=UPI003561F35E
MEQQFVSAAQGLSFMAEEMAKRTREIEITRMYAQYVAGSNVEVYVDRAFSTVHIADLAEQSLDVLLEGHDADEFIDAADELYERLGEITMEEAYQATAHPYLDLMV